eukprot:3071440-Heterocapsa_arctica.AAC.1
MTACPPRAQTLPGRPVHARPQATPAASTRCTSGPWRATQRTLSVCVRSSHGGLMRGGRGLRWVCPSVGRSVRPSVRVRASVRPCVRASVRSSVCPVRS